MFRACPYIPQGTLPENASLIRVISEEDVEFATGNSDDETIRDRDLLPSKGAQMELESRPKGYFRPYWYRHEYCKDSDVRYRRILKVEVNENGSLSFLPAFANEEDSGVGVRCSSQPSFHILQEEIGNYDEDYAGTRTFKLYRGTPGRRCSVSRSPVSNFPCRQNFPPRTNPRSCEKSWTSSPP